MLLEANMKNLTQHTYFTWSNLLMLISFVGNVSLYVMLLRTEVRKNFHNLLMLLNTFEMVSKKVIIYQQTRLTFLRVMPQFRWDPEMTIHHLKTLEASNLGILPPPTITCIPMSSGARPFLCPFLLITPSNSFFPFLPHPYPYTIQSYLEPKKYWLIQLFRWVVV